MLYDWLKKFIIILTNYAKTAIVNLFKALIKLISQKHPSPTAGAEQSKNTKIENSEDEKEKDIFTDEIKIEKEVPKYKDGGGLFNKISNWINRQIEKIFIS